MDPIYEASQLFGVIEGLSACRLSQTQTSNLKPQTRRAAFEAEAEAGKLDNKEKDTDFQHEVKVLFQRKLITLL